jgi:hypothetical protein
MELRLPFLVHQLHMVVVVVALLEIQEHLALVVLEAVVVALHR